MAIGLEASFEGVEKENFINEIGQLVPESKTFWALANKEFKKETIAFQTAGGGVTRPASRLPFRAQGGTYVSQGTANGTPLGRGNSSAYDAFSILPVFHYGVNERSHLAELATKGSKRSAINLQADEMEYALESMMYGLEGICYGDSSGEITQIPSTATVSSSSGTGATTSYITGIRAMAFTDNQVVGFFPAEGGTSRGTATISYVNPATSTVWFSTALPSTGGATQTGDFIMIAGSSGVVGQGVYGTAAWNNPATTGTIAGINRATYPGRITSPSINLAGGSVTAALASRCQALLGRAMGGSSDAIDSGIFLMGEDQMYAIAQSNYYNKQIAYLTDIKNNKVPDASAKYFQEQFGGRPTHVSFVQPLGRIDLLTTNSWHYLELVPLQLYDYGGGNTVVPVPDPGGNGWLTTNQFAFEVSFNLGCSVPLHQLSVVNASQPTI